jgi:hypothetical protein
MVIATELEGHAELSQRRRGQASMSVAELWGEHPGDGFCLRAVARRGGLMVDSTAFDPSAS